MNKWANFEFFLAIKNLWKNILTIEEFMRYIWVEWLVNVALVIYLAGMSRWLIRVFINSVFNLVDFKCIGEFSLSKLLSCDTRE